jgi:hypothetical protein
LIKIIRQLELFLGQGEKVNKLVLATIIFVVAVGIVGVIGEAIKTIDVTVYEDPYTQNFIVVIQFVFTSTTFATVFAFLRNMTGYGINYLKTQRTHKDIEYQLTRFGESWLKFEGVVLAFAGLGDLYYPGFGQVIAGGILFVIDTVISEAKTLGQLLKAEG